MKILRNKRNLIGIVIVVLIFMVITTTFKSVETKTPSREGYKTITDVPGVEFAVKKELFETATAVMEISKNIEFLNYQTYSYKNGEDTYLLFNMNSYIVIAKKGTSFHFEQTGVEESLQNNSLNGIWFSASGKDAVKESSPDKYVIRVDAQVVINNGLYNDFTGNLVTLLKDDEEWTLFAGVTAANKESADIMDYISQTFAFSEEIPVTKENCVVDEDGFLTVIEEESQTDTSQEEDAVQVTETEVSAEETTPDVMEETSASEESIPAIEVKEPEEVIDEEKSTEINRKTTLTAINNQSIHEYSTAEVYTSSVYSMLDVGYSGYMSLQNERGYQNAYIKTTRLYSAEETKKIIEEYCRSGDSYYKEFTAPEGTHFEAIAYDVNYLGEPEAYVNIKLCGMDGEDLNYRGIHYSHMTYDIINQVSEKDGWRTGYICFYAVPNGCKEYALKCGEGDNTTSYAAYYRIGE